MRHINIAIITVSIITLASSAGATVLYDGALNTLPEAQGWLYLEEDLDAPELSVQATHGVGGGVMTLDTTPDIEDTAGFFGSPLLHPTMTPLDRLGDGFTLSATLKLLSEFHDPLDNRAGLSLLILTSDNLGVELAFWEDAIWAQPEAFNAPAELAPRDTTVMTKYDVAILDGGYELYADDVLILAGPLRDYSAHWHPIYQETNLVFIGDDTSSAQAESELAFVEVLDEAIPEPATMSLLAIGGVALIRRRT